MREEVVGCGSAPDDGSTQTEAVEQNDVAPTHELTAREVQTPQQHPRDLQRMDERAVHGQGRDRAHVIDVAR